MPSAQMSLGARGCFLLEVVREGQRLRRSHKIPSLVLQSSSWYSSTEQNKREGGRDEGESVTRLEFGLFCERILLVSQSADDSPCSLQLSLRTSTMTPRNVVFAQICSSPEPVRKRYTVETLSKACLSIRLPSSPGTDGASSQRFARGPIVTRSPPQFHLPHAQRHRIVKPAATNVHDSVAFQN